MEEYNKKQKIEEQRNTNSGGANNNKHAGKKKFSLGPAVYVWLLVGVFILVSQFINF